MPRKKSALEPDQNEIREEMVAAAGRAESCVMMPHDPEEIRASLKHKIDHLNEQIEDAKVPVRELTSELREHERNLTQVWGLYEATRKIMRILAKCPEGQPGRVLEQVDFLSGPLGYRDQSSLKFPMSEKPADAEPSPADENASRLKSGIKALPGADGRGEYKILTH